MAAIDAVEPYRRANPRAFAAVLFFSPLISLLVPRLTPAAAALVVTALLVAGLRKGVSGEQLLAPTAALMSCAAFSIYVAVNASWAYNESAGLAKGFLLIAMIPLAFAAATASNELGEQQRQLAATAFVAGAALGAVFVLVELLTDRSITHFVMNILPILRPEDTKRMRIAHGEVVHLSSNTLNQNVTLVMLHFWPSILMLRTLTPSRGRRLMTILFVSVSAAAILLSEHDSSQFALLGSALVFLFAQRWPRAVLGGLAGLWCLSFALALPLSFAAYNDDLYKAESLPQSYKARIFLWEYTAEQTLKHPWLGVGVRSTREEDVEQPHQKHPEAQVRGFAVNRVGTTGHHGHSIFVQTWYELGAVGAVLLAVAGALIVLHSAILPKEAQAFAAATFASFAIIAAFAWGMWQTWWMCAVPLAAIYLLLAAGLVRPAQALATTEGPT
jgi:O-antigen ligase